MIEHVNVYDSDQQITLKLQHKKKRPKKSYLFIGLLFLILASSISGITGYLFYHTYDTDLSLAQIGLQHIKNAETLLTTWSHNPLNTQLTTQANSEFESAFKTFNLLKHNLQSLPQSIRQIPAYNTKLTTALRLVPLAITLSQMGIAGCTILNTLITGLRNPLTSQGHGLTSSDFVSITKESLQLRSSLISATRQINQLQPVDMQFDARISKMVGIFHKDAPMIQGWLDKFEQLLPVVPALLGIGTPANYLIEILDSTELRPGGGFIGNYGIATFSGGRLATAQITDADLLDKPFEFAGNTIPYPAAYTWFDLAPGSWSFRDSNLDADFPTAARYGEEIYREEGGKVHVQGIIAFTPALIEQALTITGPIPIPEYHEIITAQNLIARIHYHQLDGKATGAGSDLIPSPDGHSSMRKRFTALLADHLLAHIRQFSSSNLSKFLLLVVDAVRSKDLQIYANSSAVENILHSFHLDASIQSPTGDSLFVVDSNISANKANSFIINTLDDQITIDSQGNAIHHATLRYAWTIMGQIYGNSLYRDYVHVYVPPDSVLLSQAGWQPRATSSNPGRKAWTGFFTLSFGETRTITLQWKVLGAAQKNANSWHYQYLIQRQAGNLWKLNLQTMLPPCTTTTNKWKGLLPSNKQSAKLVQSLTQDLSVGVDYACK